MIIKSNFLVPKRFQAITYGFIICVRPECANDLGLIAHEETHVKQFWDSPILMPLRYWLSAKWRLQYEAEAYKKQLRYYSDDRSTQFAQLLVSNYNLSITISDAYQALST